MINELIDLKIVSINDIEEYKAEIAVEYAEKLKESKIKGDADDLALKIAVDDDQTRARIFRKIILTTKETHNLAEDTDIDDLSKKIKK